MSNSRPKSRIYASSLLKHLRNIRCFASVPSRNYRLSRKPIITGRLIKGLCAPGKQRRDPVSQPVSLLPCLRATKIVKTNGVGNKTGSIIYLVSFLLFPQLQPLVLDRLKPFRKHPQSRKVSIIILNHTLRYQPAHHHIRLCYGFDLQIHT